MNELYTSQVHLKRILSGEAMAAYTPAPAAVSAVMDPAFFPGLGALNEDEHGRIQCPVRGCGVWVRTLGIHAARMHRALGGASGIRAALGIAKNTPLISHIESAKRPTAHSVGRRAMPSKAAAAARAALRSRDGRKTIEARNWANTCPAQLQQKIESLAARLSHSPSQAEAEAAFGSGFRSTVVSVFGSWNNAKAVAGLATYAVGQSPTHVLASRKTRWGARYDVAAVVSAMQEWRVQHGDWPSSAECALPSRSPRIPTYLTILRVLGVESWEAATKSVERFCERAGAA